MSSKLSKLKSQVDRLQRELVNVERRGRFTPEAQWLRHRLRTAIDRLQTVTARTDREQKNLAQKAAKEAEMNRNGYFAICGCGQRHLKYDEVGVQPAKYRRVKCGSCNANVILHPISGLEAIKEEIAKYDLANQVRVSG